MSPALHMPASTFGPPPHALVVASRVEAGMSRNIVPTYKFLLENCQKLNHFDLSTMPKQGPQHLSTVTFTYYAPLHLPNHRKDAIQMKVLNIKGYMYCCPNKLGIVTFEEKMLNHFRLCVYCLGLPLASDTTGKF
jgi:hypothetical protein